MNSILRWTPEGETTSSSSRETRSNDAGKPAWRPGPVRSRASSAGRYPHRSWWSSSQFGPYFRGDLGAQQFDGAQHLPVRDPAEVHLQDLPGVAELALEGDQPVRNPAARLFTVARNQLRKVRLAGSDVFVTSVSFGSGK